MPDVGAAQTAKPPGSVSQNVSDGNCEEVTSFSTPPDSSKSQVAGRKNY
jgi:hypothetical protein